MLSYTSVFLVLALAVPDLQATTVHQCKDTEVKPPKTEDVHITYCEELPCILRRGTTPSIDMKIHAEKDINELITSAHGEIVGVPFPFLGVHGGSACSNIYSENGETQLGCPLKGGQTYLYKNAFKILQFYPRVNINILWALLDKNTKETIICFEVPAKIN